MTSCEIDADFLVRTASELVRIPSINPEFGGSGEADVADYVANVLAGLGLEVVRLESEAGRPSVIGVLRGAGGASLMLNGHYDTVGVTGMSAPFAGTVHDGRIHGRGAYDMKGAVASCIAAVKAVLDAGITPAGDVIVAAVADEEAASLGTREVLGHTIPDRVIVTEPTGLRLCVSHKGFVWAEYESAGRAAHGSRPELGIDANLQLVPVLEALRHYRDALDARTAHPLVGRPSLHLAMLRGGTGMSTYAAHAVASIERRTIPGERLADVEAELAALVPAGSPVSFRHLLSRAAFEVTADDAIVRATERACHAVLGRDPEHVGEGPWMDAALFAEAGVETVVIGPTGAGAHADEEWVDVASLIDLARILAHVAAHG